MNSVGWLKRGKRARENKEQDMQCERAAGEVEKNVHE